MNVSFNKFILFCESLDKFYSLSPVKFRNVGEVPSVPHSGKGE